MIYMQLRRYHIIESFIYDRGVFGGDFRRVYGRLARGFAYGFVCRRVFFFFHLRFPHYEYNSKIQKSQEYLPEKFFKARNVRIL